MKNLEVELILLGTGTDEQKLKKLAKSLGIQNKVIFKGHISHKDLPRYLSQADIFVRPSLSEGLGNAFLEAMAMGLPVIATPVGGIVDFVKDKETGLFCKPKNYRDLALKIDMILKDNKLKDRIALQGQKMIIKNYSWDIISQKMFQIYQKLL